LTWLDFLIVFAPSPLAMPFLMFRTLDQPGPWDSVAHREGCSGFQLKGLSYFITVSWEIEEG